ncbi:helix-turn-helix transcriptional regulator [Paenibacillus filicis]|uniref:Helix-turn-helix transcriptional regulator n=1 Tax=Paenibacillus filicis TaxID=669464 RepID=A0ABU9DTG8_9BACL
MDTLGKRIAYLRESRHLRQKELMKLLNFSNLSRFEKDSMKPGIDIILSIALYFDVTTDWLLTGREKCVDVNLHHNSDFSPEEIELLAKIRQLLPEERVRIDGLVDGLLLGREIHGQSRAEGKMSPISRSGRSSEDEQAAANETRGTA